jgi:hypothetical protein
MRHVKVLSGICPEVENAILSIDSILTSGLCVRDCSGNPFCFDKQLRQQKDWSGKPDGPAVNL